MTGICRMLEFLTALKVNNDRQWFGVHKEEYNDIRRQCLEEVGVLIAEIARFDPHLAGVAPEQCVYRIYRDIRFRPTNRRLKPISAWCLATEARNARRPPTICI